MPLLVLSGLRRTGPAARPSGDTLGHLALTSVGCVVCYQKPLLLTDFNCFNSM